MPRRTVVAVDDYTFNVFHESDNSLISVLMEIGQLVHRNNWTVCEGGFCHKLFLDIEGEVCCHSTDCIEAQKQQKEHRRKYEKVFRYKKDYDSFVCRYKGDLDVVKIDLYHPKDYDFFMQEKALRIENMTALKKGLPEIVCRLMSLTVLADSIRRK